MSARVTVELGDRSYPILIEDGLLARAAEHLAPLSRGRTMAIVTDDHVVRVTIYKWSGSTNEQRVALAEKMARSAVKNQLTVDLSPRHP